ncbi:MAG: protein kinase family protein [Mobilitalea sp.]
MSLFIAKQYYGQKIGDYTIREYVGEGRYAMCFHAVSNSGNKVIIKKFRRGIFKMNSEKNVYESVILSILKDTRIPKLMGVINQKSFYGLVLEFMPGYTVKDLLFKYKHRFSDEEFYNIGIRLISIIKYLHKNGIVHRDIRISNVLIDGENVYLIDFGLARFAQDIEYKYNLDYSYLGDFLLYLLYSSFPYNKKLKKIPWHKELQLTEKQKLFLKKLLGLETAYENIKDIEIDFIDAFGFSILLNDK